MLKHNFSVHRRSRGSMPSASSYPSRASRQEKGQRVAERADDADGTGNLIGLISFDKKKQLFSQFLNEASFQRFKIVDAIFNNNIFLDHGPLLW